MFGSTPKALPALPRRSEKSAPYGVELVTVMAVAVGIKRRDRLGFVPLRTEPETTRVFAPVSFLAGECVIRLTIRDGYNWKIYSWVGVGWRHKGVFLLLQLGYNQQKA